MITRRSRLTAMISLTLAIMLLLSGCWDEHELDSMLIITGVALDEATNPEQMDITLQIGETKASSSGSGEANSPEDSVLLLKTTSDTIMGGLIEFNRNSSQRLLLHHNQVLLIGSQLAEQGVEKRIDLFMRDQQARMEVPVVVVEGRAEEVLSAKLTQENISGIFLARALNDQADISEKYQVRLLDFVSRLLDTTSAPIASIVKVVKGEDGKDEIQISGMAVFKGDRMIGRLSNDQVLGYIWAMGNVKQSDMTTGTDLGKAVFHISALDCKRDVALREDGGVKVTLSIESTLNVSELSGFNGITPGELLPRLEQMAQDEIRKKITDSFNAVRKLNADIFGFGTSVHRKYPKEWKTMNEQWDTLFPDIELDVQVQVHLPSTGQIVQSLEMGGLSK